MVRAWSWAGHRHAPAPILLNNQPSVNNLRGWKYRLMCLLPRQALLDDRHAPGLEREPCAIRHGRLLQPLLADDVGIGELLALVRIVEVVVHQVALGVDAV